MYRSKIDKWYLVLNVVTSAICVGSSYFVWVSDEPIFARISIVTVLIISAVLMIWSLVGTNYKFGEEFLIITCGPFKSRVPYTSIQGVVPSRSIASSPACSLDRLQIQYEGSKGDLLVSPGNKLGFLQELADRVGGFEVRGESMYRGEGNDA